MHWRLVKRATIPATLAIVLAACVPVTVNVSFPQAQLDNAARQIEDAPAEPAGAPVASAPAPAPASGQSQTVRATPQVDNRSPEVVKARESRRNRRPELRVWKERGCMGETNQGLLAARPGDGCTGEVVELIRAENADRRVIYDGFMKENNIPASDSARVYSAFAKARHERARPNDWIQRADGQWERKS
jgi:uncharacterized protein YdbL (DUF1318 family)/ribosomal protein S10